MKNIEDYPMVLNVDHISEILSISKRMAYEVMNNKEFPLIKGVGRCKRVERGAFYKWLTQENK